jgi:molybdopterin/thiamine biosynthesis adenylyltransferase
VVAFTRNQPVLETPALNAASVLCIGLGSGGSIVVDQLARAGVGRFMLWDMDRLEAHNVGRHICSLRDLGRRKTSAMRDHVLCINPAARVECIYEDVLKAKQRLESAVAESDCVIVGTDNNESRFTINEVAWTHGKVSLYGRAFTRASGGDVIQVIPSMTPCYACQVEKRVVDEEISSTRDAGRVAYADAPVAVEPGLVIDIHPIANMLARLALLRLCANIDSGLRPLAAESDAPLYLWANRREGQFQNWKPMGRSYDRLSILRWYAITVPRDEECTVCSAAYAN